MSKEVVGSFAIREIHAFKPNISYVLFFTVDRLVGLKFRSVENALDVVKETGKVAVGNDRIVIDIVRRIGRRQENISCLHKVGEKLMLDPQTVLATDKRNFGISYSDINKIEMKKSAIGPATQRAGKITIFTHGKKQQFDIIFAQKFEDCVNVVRSVLPDKLQ